MYASSATTATPQDGERRTLLSKSDAPTRASASTARWIALAAVACVACVAGAVAFAAPQGARLGDALGRTASTANAEAKSDADLGCVSRPAVARSRRVGARPRRSEGFARRSNRPFFSRDEHPKILVLVLARPAPALTPREPPTLANPPT